MQSSLLFRPADVQYTGILSYWWLGKRLLMDEVVSCKASRSSLKEIEKSGPSVSKHDVTQVISAGLYSIYFSERCVTLSSRFFWHDCKISFDFSVYFICLVLAISKNRPSASSIASPCLESLQNLIAKARTLALIRCLKCCNPALETFLETLLDKVYG